MVVKRGPTLLDIGANPESILSLHRLTGGISALGVSRTQPGRFANEHAIGTSSGLVREGAHWSGRNPHGNVRRAGQEIGAFGLSFWKTNVCERKANHKQNSGADVFAGGETA